MTDISCRAADLGAGAMVFDVKLGRMKETAALETGLDGPKYNAS